MLLGQQRYQLLHSIRADFLILQALFFPRYFFRITTRLSSEDVLSLVLLG